MRRAHSNDLRERVVRAHLAGEPIRSVAARYGVSVSSVPKAIRDAGAKLWFLPPYSPDLNPIEQAFAKIKHWMRDARKRTPEDASKHLGELIGTIQPNECLNYIRNVGYGSNSNGYAPVISAGIRNSP